MDKSIPKTGIKGLKENWKNDLKAGFAVSLIALPLCLGIALASGVPPMAGLITAIIGGLIVSRIGGSFVTINGPAAGLIVITLGAAQDLGGAGAENDFLGYPHALGAILIGGIFIALLGIVKVGKFGDFFPSAAVHGMLAAIGIIIIIKQFYVALGIHADSNGVINQLIELPLHIIEFNHDAGIISLVSIVVLIIHPFIKLKAIKAIPAPMWVLILAIPLEKFLDVDHTLLVHLPEKVIDGITFPSFEKIGESAFWTAVLGVALVSGIESLLSAIAVDSQDPYERKTHLDKDLIGVGIGSSIAALIGGLPMIAEIVRSSANINNGAKTSWANFFHGSCLLLFLLIGSSVIELIPMSALATMLVYTGFRLASPKEFLHMLKIGKIQFLIFITTLIIVLFTDLLIGIASGIFLKLIISIINGTSLKNLFSSNLAIEKNGNQISIKPKGSLIFSNYISFKSKIEKLVKGSEKIELNFHEVNFIDHTFQTRLNALCKEFSSSGIEVNKVNMHELTSISNYPNAVLKRR